MNKGLSPAEQMMNIFTDKDNTSAEKKVHTSVST